MSLADTLSALDGKPVLDANDALAVRRIIFAGEAEVSTAEVEALFKLNADAGSISPEWRALFIEALTTFVVRQEAPSGYVDEAKADWLIAQVSAGRRVREDEVEMLIHVLETAEQSPAKLSGFVLAMLKASMLHGLERQGRISPEAVGRLRRVLFAVGGDGTIGVSRREAETLFDINDALAGAPCDPAWTQLFVQAVANAVLFEPVHTDDAAAELRDEASLADLGQHPLGRLETVWQPGTLLAGEAQGFYEVLHWDFANHDLELAEAADEAMEAKAERVNAEEAHWLVQRIGRNGRVDPNEQALLAFIGQNARAIDPSLKALIAGAAPAAPTQARASFGRRAVAPGPA